MRFRQVFIASLLTLAGCRSQQPPPDIRLTATMKDIMDSMVDPSGDFMFEAVAEIADEHGVTQKAPETEEEWKEVRHRALILTEGMNLVMMEGRKVAQPGEKSQFPQVELHPEEIQKLVDGDRPSFVQRARRLQDAAAAALKAADAKDKKMLFSAIESIDKACEGCHVHYWYPKDERAVGDAKKKGIY